MIQDKDIKLIEKYLSDNLTEEERKLFNDKNKTDKAFSEEILFRENLKVASERIVTAEFKSLLNNIHTDYINKKKKKVYLYSLISLSAAALILLFLFVINPLGNKYRIEKYIAEAENITTLSIQNISDINLKSDGDIEHISYGKLEVAFIVKNKNHKNYNSFFFNKNVLYLFKQSNDTIDLFYEINNEGGRIYYLCRNKQLFKFIQLEENKFYNLHPVTDSELENRCYLKK
ncbi:MAG: hypothetical protein H8D45_29850 [Bacteroidetes bacterium]|nr:hypothetical protein [Bacteroidota bacterium]MBL7102897.1 hypothetical protein [Bacteroidales bacterium]